MMARNPQRLVPRDRIELPTRGFSVPSTSAQKVPESPRFCGFQPVLILYFLVGHGSVSGTILAQCFAVPLPTQRTMT